VSQKWCKIGLIVTVNSCQVLVVCSLRVALLQIFLTVSVSKNNAYRLENIMSERSEILSAVTHLLLCYFPNSVQCSFDVM